MSEGEIVVVVDRGRAGRRGRGGYGGCGRDMFGRPLRTILVARERERERESE